MFQKKSFESVDIKWSEVEGLNDSIKKLKSYKLDQILVEGSLSKSKIAWKIATLRQSYIWRLCELAESCAINWNHQHYVASLTLARGLIETGAILCCFDERVQRGLKNKDLSFLNDEVTKKTFSTKMEFYRHEGQELATNILTPIQKMDRKLKGLEFIYKNLSEFTHPNHLGNSFHYGKLDPKSGTVIFSNGTFLDGKFHAILCTFSLIDFGILAIESLAKNIEMVAALQHKIDPVTDL